MFHEYISFKQGICDTRKVSLVTPARKIFFCFTKGVVYFQKKCKVVQLLISWTCEQKSQKQTKKTDCCTHLVFIHVLLVYYIIICVLRSDRCLQVTCMYRWPVVYGWLLNTGDYFIQMTIIYSWSLYTDDCYRQVTV